MTRRSHGLLLAATVVLALFAGSAGAETSPITITLTPLALGLRGDNGASGTKVNHAPEILADQSGLRTLASGVGGSSLEINGLGLADDASNGDHIVKITTRTHSDTLTGLPATTTSRRHCPSLPRLSPESAQRGSSGVCGSRVHGRHDQRPTPERPRRTRSARGKQGGLGGDR